MSDHEAPFISVRSRLALRYLRVTVLLCLLDTQVRRRNWSEGRQKSLTRGDSVGESHGERHGPTQVLIGRVVSRRCRPSFEFCTGALPY